MCFGNICASPNLSKESLDLLAGIPRMTKEPPKPRKPSYARAAYRIGHSWPRARLCPKSRACSGSHAVRLDLAVSQDFGDEV